MDSRKGGKIVTFNFQTDPGKEVFIASTFNGWEPGKTKLKNNGAGEYAIVLQLPVGRHEYKFVVDYKWCGDPKNPETIPNDCGTINNVIIIA
jgi:hypothetical protein